MVLPDDSFRSAGLLGTLVTFFQICSQPEERQVKSILLLPLQRCLTKHLHAAEYIGHGQSFRALSLHHNKTLH